MKVPVTEEVAKDTLQLIREWTTWIAGIQIATFAGLAVLTTGGLRDDDERLVSTCTVMFLGASLFAAAWVLSALPFVRMNLVKGLHDDNDVYEQVLYRFQFIPIRLGVVLILQHTFWALGIIFFGILGYLRIVVPIAAVCFPKT